MGRECRKRLEELLGERKVLKLEIETLTSQLHAMRDEIAGHKRANAERDSKATAESAERERLFRERISVFRLGHPDFDEVVGANGLHWPQHVIDLLQELENPGLLIYELARNGATIHDELVRIPQREALHRLRKLALLMELCAEAQKAQAFRDDVRSIYKREREALNKETKWVT